MKKFENIYLNGEITNENVSKLINYIIDCNNLDEPPVKITLYINSNGGSLAQAFSLYDVIVSSTIPIDTVAFNCKSAAVIIFLAGKDRYILSHSSFLIHNPDYSTGGTPGEGIFNCVDYFKNNVQKDFFKIIYDSCSIELTEKQLKEKIANGWYFNGQEALKYHFATDFLMKF